MWKVTEHKDSKSKVEIQVTIIVKEIAEIDWIRWSPSFTDKFNDELKTLKRVNNFSADLMYKVKELDWDKLEIWKLTVTGEEKQKLFTLEFKKSESK